MIERLAMAYTGVAILMFVGWRLVQLDLRADFRKACRYRIEDREREETGWEPLDLINAAVHEAYKQRKEYEK